MKKFRSLLFQIHLWTGLIAGIVFILLGLSGSALVYPTLMNGADAAAPKATTQGPALPLEKIIAAARQTSAQYERRAATVTFPEAEGDAYGVQFNAQAGGRGGRDGGQTRGRRGGEGQNTNADGGRGGANAQGGRGRDGGVPAGGRGGRGGPQISVDPASGTVLGVRTAGPSPLFGMIHQLHESMLLPGALGRSVVGWAGVGMLFLGLSGLYLWWPKKGQWKFAFGVRRTARGVRLYREIHGMFGIWFWIVFLFVTLTGLPLSFPSLLGIVGAAPGGPPPAQAQTSSIDVPDGAAPMPLAQIVAAAEQASNAKASAITVPVQPNRPVSVTLAGEGRPQTILVNPYDGTILSPPARPQASGLNRGTIEQLHGGAQLGPVWKFLVFLTGFLPLIFVTTGLLMWIKKRQVKSSLP